MLNKIFGMNMNTTFLALSLTVCLGALSSTQANACASCGCTLNTDWENLNPSSVSGHKFDLRYDYVNQNQLRSRTNTIPPVDASQIVNGSDSQEVERYTRNHYLTLSGDYTINSGWGVNVQVPYIFRTHSTLGTASDGVNAGIGGGQYDSSAANVGDKKMIGRYQGFTPQHNLSVMLGVKLPTGKYDLMGDSTDFTDPNPVPIDRGLQPGTGTIDGIVGACYSDRVSKYLGYSVNALYQSALDYRDEFRPGDGTNLNLALRFMGNPAYMPILQLNARYVNHDTGAQADSISTGGTLIYLSPGISAPINNQTSVYSFVQIPVYQRLNGVQLVPTFTASVGVRFTY
jgi:hypothetical protein